MSETCKNIQGNQIVVNGSGVVSGSYGHVYKQASNITQGVIGDICASDYTAQLGQISTNILNRINSVALACDAPADLVVTIVGQPGVTYTISGREVKFSSQLSPGTSVKVKYSCIAL